MSKKNKTPKQAPERPAYRIFTNKYLNDLFCSTAAGTREFCREGVAAFTEWFKEPVTLMGQPESRIIAYQAALMETAFELGWRECLRLRVVPHLKARRTQMGSDIQDFMNEYLDHDTERGGER